MMTQHLIFILPVVTTAFQQQQQQRTDLVLFSFGTIIEQKFFRIVVLTFGMRDTYYVFFPPSLFQQLFILTVIKIVSTTTTTSSINCILRILLLYPL